MIFHFSKDGLSVGSTSLDKPTTIVWGTDSKEITLMPTPFNDQGVNSGAPAQTLVVPGQVVGVKFTCVSMAIDRQIAFFGQPGGFFHSVSWAVFNYPSGTKVMGVDNQQIAGTLGGTVTWNPYLQQLTAGDYVFAITVNGAGNLAIQFTQFPTV